MLRHVLFVEQPSASALDAALPSGWRITRVSEAEVALFWLRHTPPDLILVGNQVADLAPPQLARAIKCDHAGSLLPLVLVGEGPSEEELSIEPDAWVRPASAGQQTAAAFAQAMSAWAERLRDQVEADLRLSLPSDLGQLEVLSNLIAPWFSACGFSGRLSQQLTLAVRELVANSIEWGHHLDRSQRVWVHARLDNEKASVLVRDFGSGFNQSNLPHAARPGDPLSHMSVRSSLQIREGGFGIMMTRGMVDHLCYNDAGNEAHLVKYLPQGRKRAIAQR